MTGRDKKSELDQSTGFKFVDRRRFDETGEDRMNNEPAIPAENDSVPLEEETEVAPKMDAPELGPITFSLFIQSLAHQALMSMGVIPWPDSGDHQADLDHARETIDLLSILHEKTKGNLTPSEQRFFDSVLYELRVTFLKLVQGGTP